MTWMRRSRAWCRFCHAGDWCGLREVLGVPVCFKVRVDLAVDHEHTGRARDPGLDRSEISKRAHRRGAGAVAARDRGEIGSGERYICTQILYEQIFPGC